MNEELKERFINLLKGTEREGINNLINWLENETDFFTAPASSKYHLAVEGGLLKHSLNVYYELINESDNKYSIIVDKNSKKNINLIKKQVEENEDILQVQ